MNKIYIHTGLTTSSPSVFVFARLNLYRWPYFNIEVRAWIVITCLTNQLVWLFIHTLMSVNHMPVKCGLYNASPNYNDMMNFEISILDLVHSQSIVECMWFSIFKKRSSTKAAKIVPLYKGNNEVKVINYRSVSARLIICFGEHWCMTDRLASVDAFMVRTYLVYEFKEINTCY